MDTQPMRLSDRLKYARSRMSLTLARVKEATGIGESSLSEFENGKREPTLSQLQRMAQAYKRSLSFFLEDGPVPCDVVLWRERPAEPNAAEIECQFLRLCERYRNLETWCDEILAPNLPPVTPDRDRFRYSDAQRLAGSVRGLLGLGDRPGYELIRVLEEECGVKVFHRSFEPSGAAASAKSARFGLAALLNSNNVRWRRNFDLAHELFHLLVWDTFREASEVSSQVADEREERLANVFARSLLMPDDAVRDAVGRRARDDSISFEALFDIAREFDVSAEALLWRLHYLWNRGPDRIEETKQDISKAVSLQPVLDRRQDTEAPQWPDRYQALAVKALRHGEMSAGRFAEYLEVSRKRAMEYVGQEPWEGEEVQLTPA